MSEDQRTKVLDAIGCECSLWDGGSRQDGRYFGSCGIYLLAHIFFLLSCDRFLQYSNLVVCRMFSDIILLMVYPKV